MDKNKKMPKKRIEDQSEKIIGIAVITGIVIEIMSWGLLFLDIIFKNSEIFILCSISFIAFVLFGAVLGLIFGCVLASILEK
ncbi:MAG: hypothetical protein HFJ34_01360 [Clostridia bacterium]|nr:hypothetical protein [Clostridia bacterium]